ncbi:flavodoxin I [Parabacteroides sp. PFB2-10]|uniref:flavodoxin FldA n=1 Tax=Parabacteroides sp. PFB2-10 TaxID=1742405 RepID=UPI0024767414|nr:flavodoxin FldA [Parabacteroides sp. PFB2-10]MDH6311879.1 flavodoxin I [Parabacteroides sp. PFB2-10]
MKKTAIFYGSSSGTTEDIAGRMAGQLGIDSSDVYNVGEASVDDAAAYDVLILGSSTWGVGDLQDDWEGFLPKLKKADLSGKAVAIFGVGDSSSYSDSFCDAVGVIYKELQGTGATFCGAVSSEGYSFDDSVALEGDKFVGLPLDEDNEGNETDGRISRWIEQLKQECLNG